MREGESEKERVQRTKSQNQLKLKSRLLVAIILSLERKRHKKCTFSLDGPPFLHHKKHEGVKTPQEKREWKRGKYIARIKKAEYEVYYYMLTMMCLLLSGLAYGNDKK